MPMKRQNRVVQITKIRWKALSDIKGKISDRFQQVLRQPISLMIYAAGSVAIGLHLLHGAEAAHRKLGLLTPANGPSIRWGGRLLASLIGSGFLLISLVLALGGLA